MPLPIDLHDLTHACPEPLSLVETATGWDIVDGHRTLVATCFRLDIARSLLAAAKVASTAHRTLRVLEREGEDDIASIIAEKEDAIRESARDEERADDAERRADRAEDALRSILKLDDVRESVQELCREGLGLAPPARPTFNLSSLAKG